MKANKRKHKFNTTLDFILSMIVMLSLIMAYIIIVGTLEGIL